MQLFTACVLWPKGQGRGLAQRCKTDVSPLGPWKPSSTWVRSDISIMSNWLFVDQCCVWVFIKVAKQSRYVFFHELSISPDVAYQSHCSYTCQRTVTQAIRRQWTGARSNLFSYAVCSRFASLCLFSKLLISFCACEKPTLPLVLTVSYIH